MLTLTVSVVISNPDKEIFGKFLASLIKFTPELSQLIIYHNNLEGQGPSELMEFVNQFVPETTNLQIIHGPMGQNIGFGAGHNYNIKMASSEYFAVLNDDIEFFEVWSTPMIEVLAMNPKIAQVGMKRDTCSTWNHEGQGLPSDGEPEYIEGSCLLMRTDIARKYGPFDDAYRIGYNEDADASLRLRCDGYQIAQVDLDWKHYRAKTSSRIPVDIEGYHVRNDVVFKSRWGCYLKKRTFGRTIIVKRQGAIGDVFLITPILRTLRAQNVEDEILVMTQAPQMLLACTDIDGFLSWGKPHPCDWLIDLDYAYEKDFRKHIIEAYSEVSGIKPHYNRGILYIDKARMDKVLMLIKGIKRPFAILELSDMMDNWPMKQWQKYDELIPHLKELGYTVVGIGKDDMGRNKWIRTDISLLNMFDPLESAVVMSQAALFIGHEGLLAHVAQALKIQSVVLYGCSSPEYIGDISLEELHPVISPVGCQGCRHVQNAGVGVICKRENICMDAISVEAVLESVNNCMKQKEAIHAV